MNYSTKELTASLQELTSQGQEPTYQRKDVVPAAIQAGEFSFSKDIEKFLQTAREYSALTQNISVGTY
ncbi:MAG: hypothetical protein WCS94_23620 [Verrucomicrobiota bacterium]